MDIPEIKPMELTPGEADLRKQMDTEFSGGGIYSGKAAHSLLKSLCTRSAIPDARVRDFTEPFPGGHGKSHKDVFVNNGCRGDAIFEDANFVKYLRYFIDGPALPARTVEGLRRILIQDSGPSRM